MKRYGPHPPVKKHSVVPRSKTSWISVAGSGLAAEQLTTRSFTLLDRTLRKAAASAT